MKEKRSNRTFLLFIIPALVVTCFVHVIPILSSIYISFTNLNMYNLKNFFNAPWVGFKNYANIFTSKLMIGDEFITSFKNILFFSIIVVTLSIFIAVLISLFLNQKFPGKIITVAIILIPYFMMDSVAYGLWSGFFSDAFSVGPFNIGPVNSFLMDIGLIGMPIHWKIGNQAMISIIMATIWKSWPLLCLILLAGLQGIPKDIYEASQIDGAGSFVQFFKITLPLLMPYIQTIIILSLIWSIHSYNNFLVMYGGGIARTTIIPSIAIMKQLTISLNFGVASAMAVILLIVVLIITLIMLFKRKEERI